MKEIRFTSTFKKHFKKYQYHQKLIERFRLFSGQLLQGKLEETRKDHQLSWIFSDCREVHLFPDILLIYKLIGESYVLVDIGSHSDLF